MKRFSLIMLICVVGAFSALAEITLEDEDYLPFMVEMTSDYTPEGEEKPLPKGFRCVVLRMEDNQALLVDFPRRGIFSIPADTTNAAAGVEASKNAKIQGGSNYFAIPRMAMFLANRIVSAESEWEFVLRSDVVNTMSHWYLLYGNSNDAETARAIEVASEFYSSLSNEERAKTLFVYMDLKGNKPGIQEYYDTLQPSIQAMPGYLSRGYCKSFAHVQENDDLPVIVHLSSSGRMLAKETGLNGIEAFLLDSAED